MNIFLDTEFSKFPWEKGSHLLSLGLYYENRQSYYACLDDIQIEHVSDFVKKNVLKYLDPPATRKSRDKISKEIDNLLRDHDQLEFWSVFPTTQLLEKLVPPDMNTNDILVEYGDWDFQLFKELWKELPAKFNTKCNNLTPIIKQLPQDILPNNTDVHSAISDAKWNYEIWNLSNNLN